MEIWIRNSGFVGIVHPIASSDTLVISLNPAPVVTGRHPGICGKMGRSC